MRAWVVSIVGAVACAVAVGGCGGDSLGRQPVSGSVKVDGAPLENGNVRFEPVDKGLPAGSKVSGGTYSIARKDGPSPGKYRVVIHAPVPGTGQAAPEGAMPGDPLPPPQELIPSDWNTSSEHFVEVTDKGKNEFNFEVQAKKK
jgi:hypothetical protein